MMARAAWLDNNWRALCTPFLRPQRSPLTYQGSLLPTDLADTMTSKQQLSAVACGAAHDRGGPAIDFNEKNVARVVGEAQPDECVGHDRLGLPLAVHGLINNPAQWFACGLGLGRCFGDDFGLANELDAGRAPAGELKAHHEMRNRKRVINKDRTGALGLLGPIRAVIDEVAVFPQQPGALAGDAISHWPISNEWNGCELRERPV
jgi:hypothetical protein